MSAALSLKEQLDQLVMLQEIDLKIGQVQAQLGAVPSGLKDLDAKLISLQKQFATRSARVLELEKSTGQLDAAIQINEDRLARTQQKTDAIANNRELQAATKEVDQLKKMNESLIQQKTSANQEIESLRAETQKLEAEVESVRTQRDSLQQSLQSQGEQIAQNLKELENDRAKYLKSVEKSTLLRYDRVRQSRGGVGVAPLIGGRCRACNIMFPPQMAVEITKGKELHSCPNCQRLIYVPQAAETPTT